MALNDGDDGANPWTDQTNEGVFYDDADEDGVCYAISSMLTMVYPAMVLDDEDELAYSTMASIERVQLLLWDV
ncbi:hypothetical protein L1049_005056 [Liquidambar formosana]|uniref:Uncharacterized protein n=1 Tax=Liquidambar formosana TaxID=63359 RepID=A0AAP0WWA9_LIQFO